MFFIHIPKTAGTSFRKSAEQYFSSSYIAYDYSLNSSETSALIKEIIYKRNDILLLSERLKESEIKFLSGHVPASKYIHISGSRNTITFLRDPVQRIVSEYYHFVRHNNYTGSLKSFYENPNFVNRQKKILQGVPIRTIGYIGITEKYTDSLDGINRHFGLDLPNLELNVGRDKKSKTYTLDEKTASEIIELNKEDIQLYKNASKLFLERKSIEEKGFSYVHGDIQQVNDKSVSGWAYYSNSNDPVLVTILKNNNIIGQVNATDLRPGFLSVSPPRNGYIGFRFKFNTPCKPGEKISCIISSSGQVLGSHQIDKAS
ncbi:sulfotransferase family 2 domain-containing protein [Oceanimonas smirnovii]|uniref:sulfotransferase family 2 domain-containing protein n=1 Tax=Oceanimonas smirnovii TaxID=264574 RepID=UPI00376F6999